MPCAPLLSAPPTRAETLPRGGVGRTPEGSTSTHQRRVAGEDLLEHALGEVVVDDGGGVEFPHVAPREAAAHNSASIHRPVGRTQRSLPSPGRRECVYVQATRRSIREKTALHSQCVGFGIAALPVLVYGRFLRQGSLSPPSTTVRISL
jgi:hypothetical protein